MFGYIDKTAFLAWIKENFTGVLSTHFDYETNKVGGIFYIGGVFYLRISIMSWQKELLIMLIRLKEMWI